MGITAHQVLPVYHLTRIDSCTLLVWGIAKGVIAGQAWAMNPDTTHHHEEPAPFETTDPVHAARMWDEMYSASGRRWSGNANPQLVAEISGKPGGNALDLGCGEGGDALWLASQGWNVCAVDVSAVALARAAEHQASAGQDLHGQISWELRDLNDWKPSAEFDLVSAQFLHSTALPWQQALATAAGAVRTGGMLLIVGHHPDHLPPWGAHRVAHALFTAADVVAELELDGPRWRLDVSEDRRRPIAGPDGQEAVVADVVLSALRLQA